MMRKRRIKGGSVFIHGKGNLTIPLSDDRRTWERAADRDWFYTERSFSFSNSSLSVICMFGWYKQNSSCTRSSDPLFSAYQVYLHFVFCCVSFLWLKTNSRLFFSLQWTGFDECWSCSCICSLQISRRYDPTFWRRYSANSKRLCSASFEKSNSSFIWLEVQNILSSSFLLFAWMQWWSEQTRYQQYSMWRCSASLSLSPASSFEQESWRCWNMFETLNAKNATTSFVSGLSWIRTTRLKCPGVAPIPPYQNAANQLSLTTLKEAGSAEIIRRSRHGLFFVCHFLLLYALVCCGCRFKSKFRSWPSAPFLARCLWFFRMILLTVVKQETTLSFLALCGISGATCSVTRVVIWRFSSKPIMCSRTIKARPRFKSLLIIFSYLNSFGVNMRALLCWQGVNFWQGFHSARSDCVMMFHSSICAFCFVSLAVCWPRQCVPSAVWIIFCEASSLLNVDWWRATSWSFRNQNSRWIASVTCRRPWNREIATASLRLKACQSCCHDHRHWDNERWAYCCCCERTRRRVGIGSRQVRLFSHNRNSSTSSSIFAVIF